MKLKWCILLGILSLIGIATQQQVRMPNQEIVLRFNSEEVSAHDAKNAITIVKTQLVAIGAINIQVKGIDKGDLKITYYSDADVSSIKNLLSKENTIELGYIGSNENSKSPEQPAKEKSQTYDIDVFEIKSHDRGFDVGASHALERKPENTRFLIPCLFFSANDFTNSYLDKIFKETYKFRKNSAIAIEITSNKIPEGRAGPHAISLDS